MNSKRISLDENGNLASKSRRLNLFRKEAAFLLKKAPANQLSVKPEFESDCKNPNFAQAEKRSALLKEHSGFISRENVNFNEKELQNLNADKDRNTPNRPPVNPFLAPFAPAENSFFKRENEKQSYFLLKPKNLKNYFYNNNNNNNKGKENEINATAMNPAYAQANSFNCFNYNNKENGLSSAAAAAESENCKDNADTTKAAKLTEKEEYRCVERSLYNEFIIADSNRIKNQMPDFTQLKKITTVRITDIFAKHNNKENYNFHADKHNKNFFTEKNILHFEAFEDLNAVDYLNLKNKDAFECLEKNANSYVYNRDKNSKYFKDSYFNKNGNANSNNNYFSSSENTKDKSLKNSSTAANNGSRTYIAYNNFAENFSSNHKNNNNNFAEKGDPKVSLKSDAYPNNFISKVERTYKKFNNFEDDKENEFTDNAESLSLRSNLSTIKKTKSDLKTFQTPLAAANNAKGSENHQAAGSSALSNTNNPFALDETAATNKRANVTNNSAATEKVGINSYLTETAISNVAALASQNKIKKGLGSQLGERNCFASASARENPSFNSNHGLKEHVFKTPLNLNSGLNANLNYSYSKINFKDSNKFNFGTPTPSSGINGQLDVASENENFKVPYNNNKDAKLLNLENNCGSNDAIKSNFDNSSFGKLRLLSESAVMKEQLQGESGLGKIKSLFKEDFKKLNSLKEQKAEEELKRSYFHAEEVNNEADLIIKNADPDKNHSAIAKKSFIDDDVENNRITFSEYLSEHGNKCTESKPRQKNDFNHYLGVSGISYAKSPSKQRSCVNERDKETKENKISADSESFNFNLNQVEGNCESFFALNPRTNLNPVDSTNAAFPAQSAEDAFEKKAEIPTLNYNLKSDFDIKPNFPLQAQEKNLFRETNNLNFQTSENKFLLHSNESSQQLSISNLTQTNRDSLAASYNSSCSHQICQICKNSIYNESGFEDEEQEHFRRHGCGECEWDLWANASSYTLSADSAMLGYTPGKGAAARCREAENLLNQKLENYLQQKKAKIELFNLQNKNTNNNESFSKKQNNNNSSSQAETQRESQSENKEKNLDSFNLLSTSNNDSTNDKDRNFPNAISQIASKNFNAEKDAEKAEAEEYFKTMQRNFANLNKENKRNKNKRLSTDYIFKEFVPVKNFDKDLSEIEKLGLERNDYSDYDSDSQITHRLLPGFLRNDEAYKERLANFLRLPPHQQRVKSEKMRFGIKRKFSEIADTTFNGNVSRYYEVLGLKRKNSFSLKKQFESYYSVEGESGKMQLFRLFKDREIGLEKVWQRQLKITEMDDDYMTDSEQLYAAGRHILKEISQGITSFKKNKNNCRNYKYVTANSKKFF